MDTKLISVKNGPDSVVDADDYERLCKFNWEYRGGGGVVAQVYLGKNAEGVKKGGIVKMSNLVLGKPPVGYLVDHINRNNVDNRKANLRVATCAQNVHNTGPWATPGKRKSRFKGVTFSRGSWTARICFGGVPHGLGSYSTENEAAKAYDYAAYKLFGEFAYYNLGKPDVDQWPFVDRLLVRREKSKEISGAAPSLKISCLFRVKRRGCSSPYKGVTRRGNRYCSQINANGRNRSLGTYASPEEAHEAYKAAFKEMHGFDPVHCTYAV
jgi:hypothetical protein